MANVMMQLLLDIKQLRASLQQAQAAMQQATGRMTAQANKAGRAMQTAGKKATGFGNAINFIKTRIIGAGLFFAGFYQMLILLRQTVGEVIAEFFNLDDSLRRVQSITKESDEAIEELRSNLLDLAKAGALFDQSAADVADSMFSIAQAGFTSAEALDLAKLAAEGAAVGFTEAETAAGVLVSVLKAYDRPVEDARDVMDVLFQAVDTGIILFEDLATNLGRVMASAAALNVPLEEVVGTVATLTLRGFTAAQAMTSVNRILMTFIRPSNRARKAAAALGIELNRDTIATKGLVGVMDEMWIASGQNVDKFAEMFDRIQSTRGAVSLMGDDGKLMTRVMGDMAGATEDAGAMAEALEHRAKSLKFQMAILRVQILAIATDALTPLASGLGIVVRKMNDILKGQNAFFKFFSNLRGLVIALIAAFLWMKREAIAGMFASMGRAMSGLVITMRLVAMGAVSLGTAMRTLGTIMSTFAPFLIFMAIMALPKLAKAFDSSRAAIARAQGHVDRYATSIEALAELVAEGKITPDERDAAAALYLYKDISNILADVVGEVEHWREQETELFGVTSNLLAPAMSRLWSGLTTNFSEWGKKSDTVKKEVMGMVDEIITGSGLSSKELQLLANKFDLVRGMAETAMERELYAAAAGELSTAAGNARELEEQLAEVEDVAEDVEGAFGDTAITIDDVKDAIEGWLKPLKDTQELLTDILGLTSSEETLMRAELAPVITRMAERDATILKLTEARLMREQALLAAGVDLDDVEDATLDKLDGQIDVLERMTEVDQNIIDQREQALEIEEAIDDMLVAQLKALGLVKGEFPALLSMTNEQQRVLGVIVGTINKEGIPAMAEWVAKEEEAGRVLDQVVLAALLEIVEKADDPEMSIEITGALSSLGLVGSAIDALRAELLDLGLSAEQARAGARFGAGILRGTEQGQHGIRDFMGGLALVGEAGPELVRLPRGADVVSNAAAGHALRAGGGQAPISIHAEANITTSLLKDFLALKDAVLKAMDEKLDEAAARAGMARPRLGTLGVGGNRT